MEAARVSEDRVGRVKCVDDRSQMTSYLLPSSDGVITAGVLNTPHQVDETRERRARVRVEHTRSEQNVSTAT